MESTACLTRAARARLARLAQSERTDPSESFARRQLRSGKGKSDWAAACIDSRISHKVGNENNKANPVRAMAPGGLPKKLKPKYVSNRTSINSQMNSTPRRSARDDLQVDKVSTPTNNTPIPPNIGAKVQPPQSTVPPPHPNVHPPQPHVAPSQPIVPPHQPIVPPSQPIVPPAEPHLPRTQSSSGQANSNARQTNSTTRKTKSTIPKTQSSSPQTESLASQSQSNVPETQQNEYEANGPASQSTGPVGQSTGPASQSTDNIEGASHEEDDETGGSTKSTRKRGPTVGRGLMKSLRRTSAKKMKIDVDPVIGRPRNKAQSAKFSSQIGVVARDVLPVVTKWKELDVETALDPCMEHMQIHLDVNMNKAGVRECVIERLKISTRQQRYRLHKYYLTFPNMEEAKKNLPPSLTDQQDQWNSLCEFFNSPEFKNRSRANTDNRKKIRAPHVTGRTPFTIIQNNFRGKDGEACDSIELYYKTHQNEKGWSSEDAELNWEIMLANQAHYAEEGIEITEKQIVAEVLGPANGYVKGLGYGPKPPGKSSSSKHLQQLLDDTHEQLNESRSKESTFKSKVDTLTDQLNEQANQVKEQAACLAQLMAFMKASGHNADNGCHESRDESDSD